MARPSYLKNNLALSTQLELVQKHHSGCSARDIWLWLLEVPGVDPKLTLKQVEGFIDREVVPVKLDGALAPSPAAKSDLRTAVENIIGQPLCQPMAGSGDLKFLLLMSALDVYDILRDLCDRSPNLRAIEQLRRQTDTIWAMLREMDFEGIGQ